MIILETYQRLLTKSRRVVFLPSREQMLHSAVIFITSSAGLMDLWTYLQWDIYRTIVRVHAQPMDGALLHSRVRAISVRDWGHAGDATPPMYICYIILHPALGA